VYLSILFILLIGIAIGLLLFFGRPRKPANSGSGPKKEEKPFVFSTDKPFVAARKTIKPEGIASETPKPKIVKKEKASPLPPKTVQPEIHKRELIKEETPLKTGAILEDSSKNLTPQSNQDSLDFDHLSDLIDDFFSNDKDTKDYS
jgi:hypothetical protein